MEVATSTGMRQVSDLYKALSLPSTELVGRFVQVLAMIVQLCPILLIPSFPFTNRRFNGHVHEWNEHNALCCIAVFCLLSPAVQTVDTDLIVEDGERASARDLHQLLTLFDHAPLALEVAVLGTCNVDVESLVCRGSGRGRGEGGGGGL